MASSIVSEPFRPNGRLLSEKTAAEREEDFLLVGDMEWVKEADLERSIESEKTRNAI